MKPDSISLKISNTIQNDIETKSNKRERESPEVADFETAVSLTGYGKFNYLLLLAVLPGAWSSVFDTSVVSYILPSAECDLNLTSFDKGVLNGSVYGGMIASAFLWGFLSDSLGRRKLLVIGYILDGIFDILASISPNFWMLFTFRFLGGFVISGPYAVLISYLAEFHSAKYRARIIMIAGVYISLGNLVVPALGWALIPQTWHVSYLDGSFTYNAWRSFVTVCAIPSLLGGIFMYFFDESPKFLMTAGRYEEALRVFRKVYHMNTGKHPDTYPVKVLIDSTAKVKAAVLASDTGPKKSSINILKIFWKQTKPLLTFPHVSKAALIFTIQFGGMLAVNTLRLWLPQLFATMQEFTHLQTANPSASVSLCTMIAGPSDNVTVVGALAPVNQTNFDEPCSLGAMDGRTYLNSMIVGSTSSVTYILASYFINIVGKKKLMIFGFFLAGMCGLSIFFSTNADVTLALFALFLALGGVCCSIILSIVVDIFPTNIRTMAVSLTMMSGRTGSLIGNLMFPMLLDYSCELPFFLVSGIILCSSVLSFFLPVSMGKALE